AKVLNLSLAGQEDIPAIRQAVAYAVSRDVLVVAAAGNAQRDTTTELPSYPAAYDGVLGVGAVDINGARMPGSQIGGYVDLVAPGAKVLTTTRVDGHAYVDGSSFAAPFVAGTAALVRAAWPTLRAAEVTRRLIATADPARGGRNSDAYGAGLVNPYRAVTDGIDPDRPAALPAHVPAPPDQARLDEAAKERSTSETSRLLTVIALGALLAAGLVAVVLPSGRRRNWRPGRAPRLPEQPTVVEPPEQIFL
ncbi:MAG TPA: S8 family serine peptidase, partial [Amycolatopsis sp.]|nr:S8 family serine peptidase [Amycolatopsis sp.]